MEAAVKPMLTPGQVRRALHDYPHLESFLAVWFPAGHDTAIISRGSAGRPTERLVLARADVQSVLDALTYGISLLSPLDRRIVTLHYIQGRDVWGTAQEMGCATRTVYRRLDLIHAEMAVLLRMNMRIWWAFRRFARAVCEREKRRCVCGWVTEAAVCPKCGAVLEDEDV